MFIGSIQSITVGSERAAVGGTCVNSTFASYQHFSCIGKHCACLFFPTTLLSLKHVLEKLSACRYGSKNSGNYLSWKRSTGVNGNKVNICENLQARL